MFLKERDIGILGCGASSTSNLTNSSGRGSLNVSPNEKTQPFFILFTFIFNNKKKKQLQKSGNGVYTLLFVL